MYGQVVMVDRMMTVIVTDMLHQCGRYPSIQLSMMVERHFMTSHVRQHSRQRSVMDEVTIPKQV